MRARARRAFHGGSERGALAGCDRAPCRTDLARTASIDAQEPVGMGE